MLRKWTATLAALCLFPAIFVSRRAASQSAPPAPAASAAGQPADTSQSGYVLKVTTRLVTVDVVAVDSHGSPVRELKREDFQIFEERKSPQKIEHFQYFEKLQASVAQDNSSAELRKAARVISNQLPLDQLKIPPTVLLMDAVNTSTANQLQGRAHMLALMRSLPQDTPIAVFLLGTRLTMLQGFTSDPSLLRAALDHPVTGSALVKDPRLDLENTSSYIENTTAGMGTNMGLAGDLGEVQNFEKEEYSMSLDLRAKETLNALAQIGQYLSGIPGRKNLIWVSESFPISVAPDPDTGNNPFGGIREYTDQVRSVANVLTDAQVAVYPMDSRGLQANQSLAASQNVTRPQSQMTGPQIAARISAEDNDLVQSHGTMDELAQDTGGRACKNSNDLAGCVTAALKDSSSYYELTFYPQNIHWDGRFHKIVVKTTKPGLRLSYRRGYYALDATSLAKKIQPEDHLRQACADQLPSTTIPLSVQPAPPGMNGGAGAPAGLQYMLLISAKGLGSQQEGGSYSLNVRVADCEFAQKDTIFKINERDLPKTVSGPMYNEWQSSGIPYHVALMPAADTRRIRLAVLDLSSGLTGAIDIPVSASEIARVTKPVEAPAPVATTPYVELPDKVKGNSEPKILASLTFHLGSKASGTLDWSGDTVLYRQDGDMPLDQSAGGFSSYAFGGRFSCRDGHFSPMNSGDDPPAMRFTFHNHNGKRVVVDLKGDAPVYVGDLDVDPSAQAFFDQLWKLSHCQIM